jgi:hypothetical protein
MHRYQLEYTDTFSGEANYSWVTRRGLTVSDPDGDNAAARKRYLARVKREAKAAVGLTGIRGEWSEYGDTMEFRPRGMCRILFVNWDCTTS